MIYQINHFSTYLLSVKANNNTNIEIDPIIPNVHDILVSISSSVICLSKSVGVCVGISVGNGEGALLGDVGGTVGEFVGCPLDYLLVLLLVACLVIY